MPAKAQSKTKESPLSLFHNQLREAIRNNNILEFTKLMINLQADFANRPTTAEEWKNFAKNAQADEEGNSLLSQFGDLPTYVLGNLLRCWDNQELDLQSDLGQQRQQFTFNALKMLYAIGFITEQNVSSYSEKIDQELAKNITIEKK